jgi:hypothetical protein
MATAALGGTSSANSSSTAAGGLTKLMHTPGTTRAPAYIQRIHTQTNYQSGLQEGA